MSEFVQRIGFFQRIAPPTLSRERRIKMHQSSITPEKIGFVRSLCYVIALNPDLLYCIFEFLICLPLREERGLLVIFAAVVI